jgi:hypothetical protein
MGLISVLIGVLVIVSSEQYVFGLSTNLLTIVGWQTFLNCW